MKLKRNDIVFPLNKNGDRDGGFFGRVWRRIDKDHVQVVSSSAHVQIYHESRLDLANDYKGFKSYSTGRFVRMTSLRQLKKNARQYNAHFGGIDNWGNRHTKEERKEALANREVYYPHW